MHLYMQHEPYTVVHVNTPYCYALVPLQLYGLWKSRGEDDVMSSDPVESSSRETVTQLNQEIEKLQNELQQVCDVMQQMCDVMPN